MDKYDKQSEKQLSVSLITCFPYNYPFGGGAIIQEQLAMIEGYANINWFYADEYFDASQKASQSKSITPIPYHIPVKRRFLYTAIDYYLFYIAPQLFIHKYKNLLESSNLIWVVLERYTTPMAYHLVKTFPNKRFHISVHDDCRDDYNYYRWIGRNKTEGYMRDILQKADSVDVIGANMQQDFREVFQTESIVYRRGVSLAFEDIIVPQFKKQQHWVFIGSSHSDKLWLEFFKKIETFPLEIAISFIGNPKQFQHLIALAPSNCICELKGIMEEDDIAKLRQSIDGAIFFWDDMVENRLRFSVSTKLTSYLRMGLPILGIISPLSEVYGLISNNICFDIRDGDYEAWCSWIEQYNTNYYYDYVNAYFHPTQMAAEIREVLLNSSKT